MNMPANELTSFGHALDLSPRAFGELRRSNDIAHSPANLPTSAGSAPIPSPTGLPARKARYAERV